MNGKYFYNFKGNFTNVEEIIRNFIEEWPDRFCQMTITELSIKVSVSQSSISKFVKKVGFENFKILQNWIAKETVNLEKITFIESERKLEDYINNIHYNYTLSIERTLSDLNLIKIKKIKKIFKDIPQIFTFGIGSSSLAAIQMSNNLKIIGYSSSNLVSIHDIFRNLDENSSDKKCLVIFSKSSNSKEINTIRNLLAKYNINLFIVTANQTITETKNETIIKFRTIEQRKRIVAMTSKISQLLIVDILTNWIGKRKENNIYNDFSKEWS